MLGRLCRWAVDFFPSVDFFSGVFHKTGVIGLFFNESFFKKQVIYPGTHPCFLHFLTDFHKHYGYSLRAQTYFETNCFTFVYLFNKLKLSVSKD